MSLVSHYIKRKVKRNCTRRDKRKQVGGLKFLHDIAPKVLSSKLNGTTPIEIEGTHCDILKDDLHNGQNVVRINCSEQANRSLKKLTGYFNNETFNGNITLTFDNHPRIESYVGEISQNKLHGKGIITFTNGTQFDGKFDNDNLIEGKVDYLDRIAFKGELSVNDLSSRSRGLSWFSSAAVSEPLWDGLHVKSYEGGVQNGTPHGHGSVIFTDGRSYEGEFNDGIAPGAFAILPSLNSQKGFGSDSNPNPLPDYTNAGTLAAELKVNKWSPPPSPQAGRSGFTWPWKTAGPQSDEDDRIAHLESDIFNDHTEELSAFYSKGMARFKGTMGAKGAGKGGSMCNRTFKHKRKAANKRLTRHSKRRKL